MFTARYVLKIMLEFDVVSEGLRNESSRIRHL
jgi:hypothetical protein